MSAVATAPAAPLSLPRPSLLRLTHVELRKMTDTRSGFWVLVIIVLLTLAVSILRMALGEESERTLREAFSVAQLPAAVLMPVLAILSVTSEWTQRTALTTFALVTKRTRIIVAKTLATVALSVIAVLVCLVFASIGNVVGSALFDADGSWALPVTALGEAFLLQLLGMVGGIAFGMVFLASAPAIVVYFALPTAWGILGELTPGLADVSRWLDMGKATTPLSDFDMSGIAWARLATSALLWIAVPLAIGLARVVRQEVA
jgi:ABC-2 type transport system permease protein